MRVVVTGGAGFLGRHLTARLAARGDAPVALDLAFDPAMPEGVETVSADVTDGAAMERALAGADAVIHAAAVTGLWARDPAIFERVNAGGTRTVLGAAARAGVARGLYVSSFTTLIAGGRSAPRRTVDETLEIAPAALLGPYPRAKRLGELVATEAGMPTPIVLLPAPIGPGDWHLTPPMRLLRDLAMRKVPAMIDCDWLLTDVRALADGVLAALDRGVPGRRYLLGGETLSTDAMLAEFEAASGVTAPRARVPHGVALGAARAEAVISAITGRAPTAPVTGVKLAGPRLTFDVGRAHAELGFEAPPLRAAMADALAWMAETGALPRQPAG